jgi:hypothetical protein
MPVKATGYGTLAGKVTYEGTPPSPKDINIPADNKDKNYCLKGDTKDPTWVVGPDKGVANVVIFLKPPSRHYFVVPAEQQKPEQSVVKVDQPFCAFEPHVSIAFPSFYDADSKKQKRTGQLFEVVNSAQITHNTNWTPTNTVLDSGDNKVLAPQKGKVEMQLLSKQPNRPAQEDMLLLKCNIHTWMNGYVWAFDHPWATKTREDGTYEIRNAPAGCKVQVVAWHEPNQYLLPEGKGSNRGEEIEIEPGKTKVLDIKIHQ